MFIYTATHNRTKMMRINLLLFTFIKKGILILTLFTSLQISAQSSLSPDEVHASTGILQTDSPQHLTPAKGSEINNNTFTGCDSITTLYASDNGLAGAMFDVIAVVDVSINGMYSNFSTTSGYNLYYKTGSYTTSPNNSSAWTLLGYNFILAAIDTPKHVNIPFNISVFAGDTVAFYITNTSGVTSGMRYTAGVGSGTLYIDNGVLQIYEGIGIGYPFANIYPNRIWNGTLNYCLGASGINESSVSNFSFAPNPVSENAMFHFAELSPSSIRIFDLYGHLIAEYNEILSFDYSVNCSDWKSGLYFYELTFDNGNIRKGKFVIE